MDPDLFMSFSIVAFFAVWVALILPIKYDLHLPGEISQLARDLGLRFDPQRGLSGSVDDAVIEIYEKTGDDGTPYAVYRVGIPDKIPHDAFFGSKMDSTQVGARRRRIDDGRFDSKVRVHGEERWLRALLNIETRNCILSLVEKGGWVSKGFACLPVRGKIDCHGVKSWLPVVRSVATELSRPFDPKKRLLQNVRSDPEEGVRQHCLKTLMAHDSNTREADKALEYARADASCHVRFLGATMSGASGETVFIDLLRREEVADELRLGSFEHLLAMKSPDAQGAVLRSGLRVNCPRVQIAAIREVLNIHARARSGRCEESIQLFVDLAPQFLQHGDEALVEEAIGAIQVLAKGHFEPNLVALLDHASEEVVLAALRALKKLGTTASVKDLLPKTEGVLRSWAVKQAARGAIDAIQGRVPAAAAGGLALVEEDCVQGRLSEVKDRGGLSEPSE